MAQRNLIDENGVLFIWQKIKTLLGDKVDKVAGKQLSTNDFTDELKQKLLNAGASSFDGKYVNLTGKPSINSVELNGNKTLTELGIQPSGNYALKTDIPTVPTKVSQITNDSGFQTASEVSSAIANAVGKITSFETSIVTSLPVSGVKGTIYFVPSKTTGTNQTYDEYIWVNSKWEFIGTTAIDLSGYLKSSDLVPLTNQEIEALYNRA